MIHADYDALYPISTVSKLTGVNSITLRAWESRYGLIKPTRKESGHRVYTQSDIDLINRIVGMMDRGVRIGQVKAELDRENLPATSAEAEAQDMWRMHINRMLAAVIRFDEISLDRSYTELLSLHPVKKVTDRLLSPLLQELGRRWKDASGSIAEEHFFGFYMRSKLGARFHHRVRTQTGPCLLLACLPGDLHEIGLLLFALAANDEGFKVIILGADMPLRELQAVVEKAKCDAIVVSGTLAIADETVEKDLTDLVEAVRVPVFVGGLASVKGFDSVVASGAIPCGSDVDVGLSKIRQAIGESAWG